MVVFHDSKVLLNGFAHTRSARAVLAQSASGVSLVPRLSWEGKKNLVANDCVPMRHGKQFFTRKRYCHRLAMVRRRGSLGARPSTEREGLVHFASRTCSALSANVGQLSRC